MPAEQCPSNGERWLEIMGYGHMGDQPTNMNDESGKPILFKDFDILCPHIEPIFSAIEKTHPIDPQRAGDIDLARKVFNQYFTKYIA